MAAAASPSLCGMEERDAWGEGPWNPGQPSSPAGGGGQGSWGGKREVDSAFQRNSEPTFQPAAYSITTSHGSASCCIVCHQKTRPIVASCLILLSDFGRASWDSSSVVGQGFSGPVLTHRISTHTHTLSHSVNLCRDDTVGLMGSRWD